jgi:hypothetical protein
LDVGQNGGNFEKYLSLSEKARADLSWLGEKHIYSSEGKIFSKKIFFKVSQTW